MKNSILLLALLLCACSLTREHNKAFPYTSPWLDSAMNAYPCVVISSKAKCLGCVDEKLDHFLSHANPQQKTSTLFVLDTTDQGFFSRIKGVAPWKYESQDSIEDVFPYLANIFVIGKQGQNIRWHEFEYSGDTAQILDFFPASEKR